MDGMVEQLMSQYEGRLLVPLVLVVVLAFGLKALSGLQRSRRAARRDFLELFRGAHAKDEVWLSVAIRHHFGAYLPVPIIRRLLRTEQPARALLEVCDAWDLIDVDDETGELVWRRARYRTAFRRKLISRVLMASYFLLALMSALGASVLLKSELSSAAAAVYWVLLAQSLFFSLFCLHLHEQLVAANVSLKRWLKMH